MTTLLKLLLGLEAVILILAAISHLGLPIPYLIGPRVAAAAIVEGVCGLIILYAALHATARSAFVGQAVAFAGALLVMAMLSLSGVQRYLVTDLGLVVLVAALGPGLVISDRLMRRT